MTSSSELEMVLFDTSAAVALINPDHDFHEAVFALAAGRRRGLAGHALFETYSVLTRQPPPHRVDPQVARRLIATNFPESCHLEPQVVAELLAEFSHLNISGGAVYDALVGAAARVADRQLVSCDARAAPTYAALGVRFDLAR